MPAPHRANRRGRAPGVRVAVTVLVSAALANYSWSNDHEPDLSEVLAALGRPRHPDVLAAGEQGVRRAKPPAVSTARHDDLHDGGPPTLRTTTTTPPDGS